MMRPTVHIAMLGRHLRLQHFLAPALRQLPQGGLCSSLCLLQT